VLIQRHTVVGAVSTQTGTVSMVALGVESDPVLAPGVHLRWNFDPELGFPPLGFDVFRRPHRPGTPAGVVDFTGEPEGTLADTFIRGPTAWSTADPQETSRLRHELAGGVTLTALY